MWHDGVLTLIRRYLFYHPPTFHMLHRTKMAKDILLHFDWIGLLLYTAGTTILLMGLSWGGGRKSDTIVERESEDANAVVVYPWSDSHGKSAGARRHQRPKRLICCDLTSHCNACCWSSLRIRYFPAVVDLLALQDG